MLAIPLPYINFRLSRRIVITVLGIAVCVMFVISSFIVVNSLYVSTGSLLSKFNRGSAVIYSGDSFSASRVRLSDLDIEGQYATGILVEAKINRTVPTYVVGLDNPYWAAGSKWVEGANVKDTEVKAGKQLPMPAYAGNITLSSANATVERRLNGSFTYKLFPDDWVMAGQPTARALKSSFLAPGEYSFVIVLNMSDGLMASLQRAGLSYAEMPSALAFYEKGTGQLERDLWLVIAIAATIITILLYTTMSMEILERKRDIGIMRSVGAGTRTVFFIFFTQALIIAAMGAFIGCMSGILVSYTVTSLGIHIGYKTLFVVDVQLALVALAIGMTFAASVVGGLSPIVRASRLKVRECIE